MTKIFGIETRGLYDYWRKPAELHNRIAKLIWSGAIKVPVQIEIGPDLVPTRCGSVKGYSVKIKTTTGFNISDGGISIVSFYSKSAREASRFAKQMEKKFGVKISLR